MPENSKCEGGTPSVQGAGDGAVVLIYATFPSAAEAERIGSALIQRRLAACINISAPMTSIYRWEGKLARDTEVAAILKTRAVLADRLIAEAKAMHAYTNPAFVVVPALGGSAEFLAWLASQTQDPVLEA